MHIFENAQKINNDENHKKFKKKNQRLMSKMKADYLCNKKEKKNMLDERCVFLTFIFIQSVICEKFKKYIIIIIIVKLFIGDKGKNCALKCTLRLREKCLQ